MSADRDGRGMEVVGALGALFAVVACCAGPALVAGGVLGAVGGVLRNPVVITAGMVVVAVAVGYAVHLMRRRSAGSGDTCCLPGGQQTEAPAERSQAAGGKRLVHPSPPKDPFEC
jgi:hypothetical protein